MTVPRWRWTSRLVLVVLLLGFAIFVRMDTAFYSDSAIGKLRYQNAIHASRVKVAVIFAPGEREMYYGMLLAFDDPNLWIKSENKRVDVEIVPKSVTGSADFQGWQVALARKISRDPSYVAVVGHSAPYIASMSSVSYGDTDLLYIATTATEPNLTSHGFTNIFRIIPSDEELSTAVARLCHWLRVTHEGAGESEVPVSRVGIFYELGAHSVQGLKNLEESFTRRHIDVVFEIPYNGRLNPGEKKQRLEERQLEAALENKIDDSAKTQPEMVAVLGDRVPAARGLGNALSHSLLSQVPLVIEAGPLSSNDFINHAERKVFGDAPNLLPTLLPVSCAPESSATLPYQKLQPGTIYVATDFSLAEVGISDADLKLCPGMAQIRTATRNFTRLYKQRFDRDNIPAKYRMPETLAMRGYVAGLILKQAMEQSVSVAPIDVEQTMRIGNFDALGRQYNFTLSGDERNFGTPRIPFIFEKISHRRRFQGGW